MRKFFNMLTAEFVRHSTTYEALARGASVGALMGILISLYIFNPSSGEISGVLYPIFGAILGFSTEAVLLFLPKTVSFFLNKIVSGNSIIRLLSKPVSAKGRYALLSLVICLFVVMGAAFLDKGYGNPIIQEYPAIMVVLFVLIDSIRTVKKRD